MSWLRSAINKAAEVGGKNLGPNLSRTVRNVAQHAGQAMAGGAKIVQDRLVGRNLTSSKIAIKRLDEVAKNVRGVERVQALIRWLGALKELGKDHKAVTMDELRSTDGSDSPVSVSQLELMSPRGASKVLFYDFDGEGEPMNFREVFLRSHALENIVISMILESPVDEEIHLLLEIFELCLVGSKELHLALISSIQDLAKAFSIYDEEFMSKREYLLQYARDAVIGLKLNADLERLETEIASLEDALREKQSAESTKEEDLIRTREKIQLEIQLRDILQRKRILVLSGDTEESRTQKMELLKTLSRSLKESALEAEKHIEEKRSQKEEALKYRALKAQEVSDLEKGVATEVKALQQKRDELEAQLKEVKSSLAMALKRHLNIQEEKEKFDEASSGLMAHLAAEEELLSSSFVGQNTEANVLSTWISFLKDTWELQSSCAEQKDKDTLDALRGLKEQFLQTLLVNLKFLQEELGLLLQEIKSCSGSLRNTSEKGTQNGVEILKERRIIEERYYEVEGQIVSILQIAEVLKDELQSFAELETRSKDTEENVAEAFDAIESLRKDAEAVERPVFSHQEDFETQSPKPSAKNKPSLKWADPVAYSDKESMQPEDFFEEESRRELLERGATTDTSQGDDVNTGPADETEGWEFDEIEEELNG